MAIYIVLAIYFLTMLTIGVISCKKANSLNSFVVGSRSAGPWVSAFAYGTTYFSAVLFIGYAGRSGWDFGLWAILIGVGNAVLGTWLAWVVLANRTREVTRKFEIKTMPQLFEKRYDSKAMKIFAAIIIFVFMTPYSASVYSGLSYLFESLLGIEYHIAMMFIAIISAIYLVLGGYVATLYADLVQGIVMIFGIIAMVIFIVNSPQVGGIGSGIDQLTIKMQESEIFALSGTNTVSLISLILLTSIGSWGMPQMIHKFYGISDKKCVKTGTIISTAFSAIIACGAYFVGSLSRLFFKEVPTLNGVKNYDLIIPDILMQTLPQVLLGIVLVLVLSASVSTLSGITLTSCSTISMDLVQGVLKPKMDHKKVFTFTRVLCLIFIMVSYILASYKTPILMLMSFSWGSVAGSFLAPYVLGLFWRRMNKIGAWMGMAGGLAVSILCAVISGFNAANAPIFSVISITASFALCYIGSVIANKLNLKHSKSNEDFFENKIAA